MASPRESSVETNRFFLALVAVGGDGMIHKKSSSQPHFPDAVFVAEDGTIIRYVNIQTVLETNEYVPIGEGRYQIRLVMGRFACYRCLRCTLVSMFRTSMSNFFSHVQHHVVCEEHKRRQLNINRLTLSWSYALFGRGHDCGMSDHRLVAYFPC